MRKIARTLVSIAMFVSSLVFFGLTSDAKTTEPSISKENRQLVLQHAKDMFAKKDAKFDVAWHSSHYSHGSHGSHDSHASHYSHYSSRY